MELKELISDSIKYPSSDWKKVLRFGVICIVSVVLFPIPLLYGYLFRIIKSTLAGVKEVPNFDEIVTMFVDGLKLFVVNIFYAIPIYILYGIMIVFGSEMMSKMIMSIVILIATIIIYLVGLMAVANMAYYDGDIGAAFRFNEILGHISRIGWGKYIITLIVILIIAGIGVFIGWLTVEIWIGFILFPLIFMPYIGMFVSRAFGLLVESSLES